MVDSHIPTSSLYLLFNQIVLILICVDEKKILNQFHPHPAFLFKIRLDTLGSGKENPPKRIQKRRTQRYESG